MPISSVVITYADSDEGRSAGALLDGNSRIELGTIVGLRQAAVLETRSRDEDKSLWDWINACPGVTHVDVVFVSLIDDEVTEDDTPDQLSEIITNAHEVQR